MKKELDEAQWQEIEQTLQKVFSGMPCTNRMTRAEEAELDRLLDKERQRREARQARKLKRQQEKAAAEKQQKGDH